jgi:hypothetical protein
MADFAQMPGPVTAGGDRSVAAGGDIWIGPYWRCLPRWVRATGKCPQYADGLVAELDLPHFAGRQWLLDVIDEFLRSADRGYFVLEADAGLGKTTFCAWPARSRGYPVHFVRIPGGTDPAAALKNLAPPTPWSSPPRTRS